MGISTGHHFQVLFAGGLSVEDERERERVCGERGWVFNCQFPAPTFCIVFRCHFFLGDFGWEFLDSILNHLSFLVKQRIKTTIPMSFVGIMCISFLSFKIHYIHLFLITSISVLASNDLALNSDLIWALEYVRSHLLSAVLLSLWIVSFVLQILGTLKLTYCGVDHPKFGGHRGELSNQAEQVRITDRKEDTRITTPHSS